MYWKSPLSGALLDALNSLTDVRFSRVVDYTDLLALAMLPFAWLAASRRSFADRTRTWRAVLAWPVGAVTLAAIMGTSVLTPEADFEIRNGYPENPVDDADILAAIGRVTAQYKLQCTGDPTAAHRTACTSDDIDFWYELEEATDGVRFDVFVKKRKGILFWRRYDYELIDEFRNALKSQMRQLSPGMEYVEKLSYAPRHY